MIRPKNLKQPGSKRIEMELMMFVTTPLDMNLLTRLLFWESPPYHS